MRRALYTMLERHIAWYIFRSVEVVVLFNGIVSVLIMNGGLAVMTVQLATVWQWHKSHQYKQAAKSCQVL